MNVPATERLVRLLLGLGLALYAWLATAPPNLVFVSTGVCIALTGIVGFCPACALVGRRLQRKG
ncbi:MAG TPA: YgaP-like transmembrane domain [Xanthomonadales bacterium]|nr:YgaP-like transmembrane domain [Xanthomonadales bacterium]